MKGDTALGIAFLALLYFSWRAKAENEAEITALLYSYNGQDWLPLQGAVIDSRAITVGVQWKSITASMGVTIKLRVDSETQEGVLGIDPGDTGRVDFSVTLDDGSYTAEVTLKETASGKVLDSRLASFTVATAPPPPAEFALSGLTVSPAQVQVDNAISTSVVVKNIGGAPGNYSILIICDELVAPIPKTGTLLPGEGTTLSSSWIARTEGVHEVTVDSLSATYEVVAAPPPPEPEFRVSKLTIPTWQVEIGTTVNASVLVENIGAVPGIYTVTFTCDEIPDGSMGKDTVELMPGGSQKVYAYWTAITEGVHTVTADGLSKTYEVKAPIPPPPPPVCTLGVTKCEGLDLYSCQMVGGSPAWVLAEANSTACGYIPPPPPVCTEGEYKCVGVDRHVCQNNQWVLQEQNSPACGYEPPPPGINVGGTLVILKCDTLTPQTCVTEVPSEIEAGILTFPQAVRDFLNEKYGQFEVWIWPERWWPSYWPGGGDDSYHRKGSGMAYGERCEISRYEPRTVLHEMGHCLDAALDYISKRDEWVAICTQYWPTPGTPGQRFEQLARTIRYMYTGETDFDISGKTWCEMYPDSCVFARAVVQDPWSYAT